ncbi:MAG: hypothetical protein ABIA02_02080 [Candidatus Falkowbacteria bacterium]
MKKYFIAFFLICAFALTSQSAIAEEYLWQRLSGYILLQVESHGEAWYVYPNNQKKYYLDRPADAFDLMRNLGLGATHKFITDYTIYPDHVLGKILLDVEQNGEAYYIYPKDKKAYYLGRPADAFNIMRNLSLGITNENLNKINTGYFSNQTTQTSQITTPIIPTPPSSDDEVSQIFTTAASAIRNGKTEEAVSYFIPEMKKAIEYTMDFLDAEGKLTLSNIMSGATLYSSEENKKIYSTEVYFSLGGYKIEVNFSVEKKENGNWLLTNL